MKVAPHGCFEMTAHTANRCVLALPALLVALGCSSNNVSSNDDARAAYLGLDGSIDKAIDLGFEGFNAARSANIPTEAGGGLLAGTLTVSGQVDQGASSNKQMRLSVEMAGYKDVDGFIYDTAAAAADGGVTADAGSALPALDMSLQGIPTGTLSGSLAGTFQMSGNLSGPVALNLTFTGDLEPTADGGAAGDVARKAGTTHVTGTATSPAGTFTVDVTK